jgi:hypothetical protein
MANQSNFPTSLDAVPTDMTSGDALSVDDWNKYLDGIYNVEEKVGIDDSAVSSTIDYKLKNSASLNPGHWHNNAGLSDVPYSVIVDTVNATINTVTTSAHGLGARPTKVEVSLVCITAEFNWSVNDEIMLFPNYYDGANSRRLTVGVDATNVIIMTHDNALAIFNKTTGGFDVITASRWKIRVRLGV